jgi:peptidoglycan/LPS O-acetylase OafA/YrhL
MFYLFFPLVCRILGRGKLLIVTLLAFVALGPPGRTAFAHGSEVWSEYCYLGGMEGIALGCLTAIVVSRILFTRFMRWLLGIGGTAVVAVSLIFSVQINKGWLGRTGLGFTVLGLGTCMFIAATAQTQWKSPRILRPLLALGQYSYEVYLTHMFVVFGLFGLFLSFEKPMRLVPMFFITTRLAAGFLGTAVSRLYSEPMNQYLRHRWRGTQDQTAFLDAQAIAPSEGSST